LGRIPKCIASTLHRPAAYFYGFKSAAKTTLLNESGFRPKVPGVPKSIKRHWLQVISFHKKKEDSRATPASKTGKGPRRERGIKKKKKKIAGRAPGNGQLPTRQREKERSKGHGSKDKGQKGRR
jgi:hypothetical protein